MSNEISLTTWLQAERIRLEEFAAMWRRKSEAEPADFPERMDAEDWDEQFLFFSDEHPLLP